MIIRYLCCLQSIFFFFLNIVRVLLHFFMSCSLFFLLTFPIPHLVAKYAEDLDFVAMNKKFNKDKVWRELGNHSKAHLRTKADASVFLLKMLRM